MKEEYSVIIHRGSDVIFNFLKDFSNHRQFVTAIKSVDKISDGEISVGTRYIIELSMMGKSLKLNYEIAGLEENKFIRAKAIDSPIEGLEQRYSLASNNGGTEVKLEFEGEPGALGGMFSGFIKNQVDRQVKNDLESLKKLLEE